MKVKGDPDLFDVIDQLRRRRPSGPVCDEQMSDT